MYNYKTRFIRLASKMETELFFNSHLKFGESGKPVAAQCETAVY